MELLEVLGVVALPTLGGAVAWGRLNQRVAQHDKDIEDKAGKDVVDAKFDAVIDRLDRIEAKLDRNSRSV